MIVGLTLVKAVESGECTRQNVSAVFHSLFERYYVHQVRNTPRVAGAHHHVRNTLYRDGQFDKFSMGMHIISPNPSPTGVLFFICLMGTFTIPHRYQITPLTITGQVVLSVASVIAPLVGPVSAHI